MNRRTFMQTIAMLSAGALPQRLPASAAGQALSRLANPELPAALADHEALCRTGRHYLRVVPAEADISTLARTLLPARQRNSEDLTTAIRGQVGQDFLRGDTVQLGGWVLARTEARQAALYALLYG